LTSNPRDVSVVVQGPVDRAVTEQVLSSVRKHLPGAEIVLSTWAGTQVDGMEHDILLLNEDPGPLKRPSPTTRNANINRMIVSTRNGLLAATRSHAIKTRTDVIFDNASVLSWQSRYPKRSERPGRPRVFTERVVASTFSSTNPRRGIEDRLYHLSDIFQFGNRLDLIDLWAAPTVSEDEPTHATTNATTNATSAKEPDAIPLKFDPAQYSNEQYVWLHCVARRLPELSLANPWDPEPSQVKLFESFVADNVLLVDADRLGIRYMKHRLRPLGTINSYTLGDWLRLYREHCDPSFARSIEFETLWRDALVWANNTSGKRLLPALFAASGRWKRLIRGWKKA
jgi:WavE lipopolysaccharide synthesis